MVTFFLMMMVLNFSEAFKIAVQICLDGLTNDDDEDTDCAHDDDDEYDDEADDDDDDDDAGEAGANYFRVLPSLILAATHSFYNLLC